MDMKDLSARLRALNAAADDKSRQHASSVVREMVNSLESVNNLVYLISLQTQDPAKVTQLVEMLQSALPFLNEVVQSTLEATIVLPVPGSAKTPHA
ncbi:hypothetical protein GRAN_5006 [Granulicella sibirica]|uniref:Uncharacterized protein n=1 Tax=Granulicella sibirica TaxID=2479048 RepID=A0A4Q0STN4_9BACT|nr:hypothetical protein GRAN_5006 [Granulicella sibirica]